MKVIPFETRTDFKTIILAGDIGGTNTNLGFVGYNGDLDYHLLLECVFPTQEVEGLHNPLEATLAEGKKYGLAADICCISGAGPVKDNYCQLTNAPWDIDGEAIQKRFAFPTVVINDFMALSYALPLLNPDNPRDLTKLPHSDGSLPSAQGSNRAIFGAGTGLGVGFSVESKNGYLASPSEGGHMDFGPFDEETSSFRDYMWHKTGLPPDGEAMVSGQGIAHIFGYFREIKKIPLSGVLKEIDEAEDNRKPPLISQYSRSHPLCLEMMNLFIKMYGKIAGNIALAFIPRAGLYLAGGIITKNLDLFTHGNLFMRFFELNHNHRLKELLQSLPVYVINNYSISLMGAANAAKSILL